MNQKPSVLDGLPDYVVARIERRMQVAASERMNAALGRAAVNLSPEQCDDLVQRLLQVKPAARLPEDCHPCSESPMVKALVQATADLSPEQCDDLARRLRRANRPARLPEGCHLSPQSRALFNLLVRKKGKARVLKIARCLWPKEYEHNGWADLDPRSPEYDVVCGRISKAQQRLGEQLVNGGAKYALHFSGREGIVTLERL